MSDYERGYQAATSDAVVFIAKQAGACLDEWRRNALCDIAEVIERQRHRRKPKAKEGHWYAAQVHQRREDDPVVVTAILAYRSPEQAKAAVEAMHLVGAEGRDAYVWPPDEAATLSRLPRSQAAYRAIEDDVRRRWGET